MKRTPRLLEAALLAGLLLLPAALRAQSDLDQAARAQQQNQAEQQGTSKARVWTNEDLPKATPGTVSVVGTAAPPPAEAAKPAAGGAAGEGAKSVPAGKPASPEEIKALEDSLQSARKGLQAMQTSLQILQGRLASETDPSRRAEDASMLARGQGQIPGLEAAVQQAEKELAAAKAGQPQGKTKEAESQPAPPSKPPGST